MSTTQSIQVGLLKKSELKEADRIVRLAFGTFLGMAAVLVMFFGTPLVNWYLSLVTVR